MSGKFEPYKTDGLPERPFWWKVRVDEIQEMARGVKKGAGRVIAVTPGAYPVFAIFYNCPDAPVSGANWSAAASSRNPEKYKSSGYEPQTVVICAGIHGAEAEGVAAAACLVSLMETGKDLRGQPHDSLLALLRQYRLIILPCVNMDGRAISPDHLAGSDLRQFKTASQGAWLNGRLIDWNESKEYFPLPLDKVSFPGGYPNSEGYNIMHDCAPGCLKTAEAGAVLRLAETWQADLFLNLHSHTHAPVLLPPGKFNYAAHISRGERLHRAVMEAFKRDNLIAADTGPSNDGKLQTVNLNTAVSMASGALSLVFESTVSPAFAEPKLDFDRILKSHYILFEELLTDGLKDKFSPRGEVARSVN